MILYDYETLTSVYHSSVPHPQRKKKRQGRLMLLIICLVMQIIVGKGEDAEKRTSPYHLQYINREVYVFAKYVRDGRYLYTKLSKNPSLLVWYIYMTKTGWLLFISPISKTLHNITLGTMCSEYSTIRILTSCYFSTSAWNILSVFSKRFPVSLGNAKMTRLNQILLLKYNIYWTTVHQSICITHGLWLTQQPCFVHCP